MNKNTENFDVIEMPAFCVSNKAILITKLCHLAVGFCFLVLPFFGLAYFFIQRPAIIVCLVLVVLFFVLLFLVDRLMRWGNVFGFSTLTKNLRKEDWVCVELEVSGTEDKFRLMAPDRGILVRGGRQIRLYTQKGIDRIFEIDATTFQRIGKKCFCTVSFLDEDGNDSLGYAASIFGYGHPFIDQGSPFTGNEFYDNFLIWLGKRREEANASSTR